MAVYKRRSYEVNEQVSLIIIKGYQLALYLGEEKHKGLEIIICFIHYINAAIIKRNTGQMFEDKHRQTIRWK